jgi:hypothetical protein
VAEIHTAAPEASTATPVAPAPKPGAGKAPPAPAPAPKAGDDDRLKNAADKLGI